ncbi:hypothetical protein LWI29_035571 [Acer saccharum]|uniref:Retrovirus-related Pol polyprotein from transposon TNT 1-94-like beta-barrel domain-containing protein n=1 Tax=Acer saccharum TaxID=4024 RepID=A0AA39TGS2_ACESA|nr:hypothetical protein LWI29_035571 [Acer saccharum]
MDMMGKGNVRMLVNGLVHIITGVFYVPRLQNSLISIGQLAEKGLAILIQRGTYAAVANGDETEIGEPNAAAVSGDETEIGAHSSIEESDGGSNGLNEGDSSGENHSLEAREQRLRRQPTWMGDYVSEEGLFEEADMAFLAMFATNDPVLFEEALKDEKWRTAMDVEIAAIEKNDT